MRCQGNAVLPIELFERLRDWSNWLENNHNTSSGVWLQLAKKGAGVQSISYAEAIQAALPNFTLQCRDR
jgi:uncharacterized protein YdeI (YjbR/CyaY-like superfamily)